MTTPKVGRSRKAKMTVLDSERLNRDKFMQRVWPAGVPRHCTRLDASDTDCLQNDTPRELWCESCRTFDEIDLIWQAQTGRC